MNPMSKYNEDLLDTLSILGFIIGIANYNENLTQSDKQDIVENLDKSARIAIDEIHQHLEAQDAKLDELLRRTDNNERSGNL